MFVQSQNFSTSTNLFKIRCLRHATCVLCFTGCTLSEIQHSFRDTMYQYVFCSSFSFVNDTRQSGERRLLDDLLSHYKGWLKNGRPVRNASHTVSVLFGLGLIQMELNEKDNQLTMSMWTRYVSCTLSIRQSPWKESLPSIAGTSFRGGRFCFL